MSLDVQVKIEGAPAAVNAADRVTAALGRTEDAGEKVGAGARKGMAEAERAMSNLARGFGALEATMSARARSSQIHAQMSNTLAKSFAAISEQIGRERAMLDAIRGPMERYEQDVRTLTMLHQRGAISAREYRDALAKSKAQAGMSSSGSATGMLGRGAGMAVATVGATVGVREMLELSDSATSLRNRIRQVTGSGPELQQMLAKVGQVADNTASNINTTGESFVRLVQATKGMGLSQERALKITETLNMALQSSGASASEASAGTLQLMQAMAAGALQGDEFRSVAENMPQLLDVFAKQLGISRGELKKMGSEGKITADIMIKALEAFGPAARKTFEEADRTSEQTFTRMKNHVQQWWGEGKSAGQMFRDEYARMFAETTRGAVQYIATVDETTRRIKELNAGLGFVKLSFAEVSASQMNLTQEQAKGVIAALEYTETGFKMAVMLQQQLTHMQNLRFEVARLAAIDPWGDQRTGWAQFTGQVASAAEMFIRYRQEGAEAMKAFRSPLEKHQDDLKGVKDMWDQGKISADEYTKAVKFMNAEFSKTQGSGGMKTFGHESPGFSSNQALEVQMRSQAGAGGAWADAITSATSKWADNISSANLAMIEMQRYMEHVALQAAKYQAEMMSANDGIARGFNKIDDEIRDSAQLTENLLVNAFHGVEDAIVHAAMTGEVSFSSMLNQLQQDFARLSLRKLEQGALGALDRGSDAQAAQNQAAAAAMMQVTTSATSSTVAMAGMSTASAAATTTLAALTAAAAAAAASLSMTAAAGAGGAVPTGIAQVQDLFGFAEGGSFMVGGHGGTDSQVVAFRASPDESVTIERPDQRGGGQQPVMVYLDPRAYVRAQKSPMGVQVLDDIQRRHPRMFRR